ncbi:MAG TPA: ATP-dependent DNA ligase [Terriglobales bacterium]|jgi:DNA ligase-1|nr:ATP-dependent DNA ligase [Terriglobales bacterium]
MLRFAQLCEAVARTTKKLEKRKLVADYFRAQPEQTASLAAIFLSGDVYPGFSERTLNVGGSLVWRAVQQLTGRSDQEMAEAYRRHGDLGATAHELWSIEFSGSVLTLPDLAKLFDDIATARGPSAKLERLIGLLKQCSALEAKFAIKMMVGDLRIGMRESLVEEAIAAAYCQSEVVVRRANMLLGDIGETLRLAAEGRLEEARMRLFHPIGFMLAAEVKTSEEALSYFSDAQIEDKYDGIRAQVHCGEGQVRIFSRTQDEIGESFPELLPIFQASTEPLVLDGEILAWGSGEELSELSGGSALPFSALQQRLGRKRVSEKLMRDVPVVYVAFDVLFAHDELTIDRPLSERSEMLTRIVQQLLIGKTSPASFGHAQSSLLFEEESAPSFPRLIRAPSFRAQTAEEIDRIFSEARARGNEGLMMKDRSSLYAPGRRGRAWLKMKRELATLDCVVTAVEFGNGKRAGVLSDYTFAVRGDDGKLMNVGKAYSGLTDAEIAEMTDWFKQHTLTDFGHSRLVEPKIVLEVAFNNVMRSERHESGFALRFPRIVRLRPDKPPEEADTVEKVEEIYLSQHRATKIG